MQWLGARIESRLVRPALRARSALPTCVVGSRESFARAPRPETYVVPNGFDAAPGTNRAAVDGPDRNHARRGNLRQPLAAIVTACRRSTEHAPSGAPNPGDQLRRPAGRGMATHSRGGAGAVHRRAPAHSLRRVVRRSVARACPARRGQRSHDLFNSLQDLRLHGRRAAHSRARAARRRALRIDAG